MKKSISLLALLMPWSTWADPLDQGEAYTTRQDPPEWMDGVDLTWLIVDYGFFAIAIVILGWVMLKRPENFAYFEAVITSPFRWLFNAVAGFPVIVKELAQGLIGLVILFTIASWVFFCQWLSHHHLGAISMIGLALLAIVLVRVVKKTETPKAI